jgi:hypothetical protein
MFVSFYTILKQRLTIFWSSTPTNFSYEPPFKFYVSVWWILEPISYNLSSNLWNIMMLQYLSIELSTALFPRFFVQPAPLWRLQPATNNSEIFRSKRNALLQYRIYQQLLIKGCSSTILGKLPVVLPLRNLPKCYGAQRFLTVFKRALCQSLSWARSIQRVPSHPISSISIQPTYWPS